jgi:hypothetical protein
MWQRLVYGAGAALAVLVLGVCGLTPARAAAHGASGNKGNNPDVLLCKHGGWRALETADGQAFRNQGQCVSYAAHGGAVLSNMPGESGYEILWATFCAAGHGDFTIQDGGEAWNCAAPPPGLNGTLYQGLVETCSGAGGSTQPPPGVLNPPYPNVACLF